MLEDDFLLRGAAAASGIFSALLLFSGHARFPGAISPLALRLQYLAELDRHLRLRRQKRRDFMPR